MDSSFSTLTPEIDVVEQVLSDFQDAWKRGNPRPLTHYFERIQNESPQVRESIQLLLVLHDQTLRWQMWRRQRETLMISGATTEPSFRAPLLEDYVRQYSLDGGLPSLPTEIVAHEFRLRTECGDSPTTEEYLHRFPQQAPTLVTLLMPSTAMGSQITVTKDNAPTAVDPALSRDEPPRHSLETTLPMSREEMPKRQQKETTNHANFGQYELLDEIARGAMGVVYRARHVTIDKIVALKMILAGQFATERQVEQFLREAQNAGRLEHDNIVRIYDAGKINDQYYIAMAYIEGQSLADVVRVNSLSAKRAAEIVEAVARALHFAHVQPQPVYHRDIKPANILLDQAGRPYVTDFGIAKRVERDSLENGKDDIAGTPSYMPPEQTYGRNIGPWSDVYSTGALLYHLLTGRPPFLGESLLETIRQVRQSEPLSPRELNPKVDPDLEAVCLKCLEKDSAKRYQTAEGLAEDLQRFLNHIPTQARPLSVFGRFDKWCRRNTAVAALTTLIAALLIVVSVVSIKMFLDQRKLTSTAQELATQKSKSLVEQENLAKAQKEKADAEEERADAEKKRADAEEKGRKDADELATQKSKSLVEQEKLAKAQKEKADAETKRADAEKKNAIEQQKLRDKADKTAVLAEENLQRAVQAINVILTRSADSGLKNVPGMEEFRKRVAQDALEQLKPILEANADHKEALEARAKVRLVQARLLDITGKSDEAEKVYMDAIAEYDRLRKAEPSSRSYLLETIIAYRQWGDSLTDRSQLSSSVAVELLRSAINKYTLALECGRAVGEQRDVSSELELARTLQSQSISCIYLKEATSDSRYSSEAIVALKQAITLLERLLPQAKPSEVHDIERQLANSLRNLANEESFLMEQPDQIQLERWLGLLDRASEIIVRLSVGDRENVDLRYDSAVTRWSRARLLMGLATSVPEMKVARLSDALREVLAARDGFSGLAVDFQKIPLYEYLRIRAIHLHALILTEQGQFAESAQRLQDANEAIQKYHRNPNFQNSPRESVRLVIAIAAARVCSDCIERKDRATAKRISEWLRTAVQELREAKDSRVKEEATKLDDQIQGILKYLDMPAGGSK